MNYNGKMLPAIIVGLIVAVIGYYVLNAPDNRDPAQKVGDALNELHNGPEKAVRQLESRTPGDKLEDAVKDEKENIKKTLNQQ